MNHEQFAAAVKALHAPAERQKILADAMGEKYGAHSKQYKDEFAKYCRIKLSIAPREWEIWCEYCIFLFTNGIEQKGKAAILKDIVDMATDMAEEKKAAWRKVYTTIKSLS
jgi:hypothetical protein